MFFAFERGSAAKLADLDRCLELEPIHGQAFQQRAGLRLAAGDALADCDAALKWCSEGMRDWSLLCRAKCWQALDEPRRALTDLEELLDRPDLAMSVDREARSLRELLRAAGAEGGG